MEKQRYRRFDRVGREPLISPGRPTAALRENYQRFWQAISCGLTSEEAATHAGMSAPVGTRIFRHNGGMKPKIQFPLSGRFLSFCEREEIAILYAKGVSVREIARQSYRDPSTISRELRRHASTRSGQLEYRAITAQWHADRKAKRPKASKLATNNKLRKYV